jgi:hypothetical protein
MITVTQNDVLEYAYGLDLTEKGQKDRHALALRLANAMGSKTLDCRKDFNLGQLYEAFIKADRLNLDHARYSKCNTKDLEFKNGSYEIKVSTSTYSLSTPLTEPTRTIFVCKHGACILSKEFLAQVFANPYKHMDDVKIEKTGLRLKPTIYEFGTPLKWLNEKLGF